MKPLKSVARRGGTISVAALSALALVACSAGQITQTSSQVAAVDGSAAGDRVLGVSVMDVSVVLDDTTGHAALKFTASNQDPSGQEYALRSVEVDGQNVEVSSTQPIPTSCSLVADSAEAIESIPQYDHPCIQYAETSLTNRDFAYGGNVPVSFRFSNLSEPIEVQAAVVGPQLPAGSHTSDYTNGQAEEAHH